MKKTKWLIACMLFVLCFLLSSEVYQGYLEQFEKRADGVSLSGEPEMFNETVLALQEADLDFFLVKARESQGDETTVTLYVTGGARGRLISEYSIIEKKTQGFISGSTVIEFVEISPESLQEFGEYYHYVYFLDEDWKEITEQIGVVTNLYELDSSKWSYYVPGLILIYGSWILTFALLLLLTWFDIQFSKKESFILVSFGKNRWQMIVEHMVKDFLGYLGLFIGAKLVIGQLVYEGYQESGILIMFSLFLFVNAAMYLTYLKYGFKKIIYGANVGIGTLSSCYLLKTGAMIFCMIMLAYGLSKTTANWTLLFQTDKLLEAYDDYVYIEDYNIEYDEETLQTYMEEHGEELREQFLNGFEYLIPSDFAGDYENLIKWSIHQDLYRQGKTAISYVIQEDENGAPSKMVMNENSFLSAELSKLLEENRDGSDLYVFVPENKEEEEENRFNGKKHFIETDWVGLGIADIDIKVKIVPYNSKISQICFEWNRDIDTGQMYYHKDGIVKTENITYYYYEFSEETLSKMSPVATLSYEQQDNRLYRLDEEDFAYIKENYGTTLTTTSAETRIEIAREAAVRSFMLYLFLDIGLISVEMMLIVTIIRAEYQVNAKFLAIKKIMGHTVFKKNRQLFVSNLIASVIGIIIAMIIALMTKKVDILLLLLAGGGLFLLEAIFILYYIRKLEKQSLVKILKGGSL